MNKMNRMRMGSRENEKLDRKTAKGIFIRLGGYVLKHWHLFVPAIIFTLLSNQLSLMGPQFSGVAIDAIANKNGVDYPVVWENIFKMLG